MEKHFPSLFLERLKNIIPADELGNVIQQMSSRGQISVRINTIKTPRKKISERLTKQNIGFKEISWAEEALIIEEANLEALEKRGIFQEGLLYRQSLSSMLPVIVLDPHSEEDVLDMCAAPGSKATHIAARMNNQGHIVCIERVKKRYYKLKSVVQIMGAGNIFFHLMDARKFRPKDQLFDKILVDAPCSSEGRFNAKNPKSFAYWSPRKIKEMAHKQKGLLLAAARLLRPGGILVYSTCTFAPEENEGVIHWLLKKTDGGLETEEIVIPEVRSYATLKEWNGKVFHEQTEKCFRVLPTETTEGFFIARLKKKS